jgi:hypothetical protein
MEPEDIIGKKLHVLNSNLLIILLFLVKIIKTV